MGEPHEREGLRETDENIEGWSGGSLGGLADSETEVDRMTVGEPEGSRNKLTVLSWDTQESGAGGLEGRARADKIDNKKPPSAAASKEGARDRHGVRPGHGGKYGGWRENTGS